MKKTMFILGSVETLTGIVLYSLANMLKNLMPVLGRIAFQGAAAGSYSPSNYILNITVPTAFAVVLMIVGLIQIVVSIVKKENR